MFVSKLEKSIGIEVYATHTLGIGGAIKQFPEDFLVEETLVNGSKAEIYPSTTMQLQTRGTPSSSFMQQHLLCVLVKRNWDNFQAVRAIAQQLGISPQQIHIAGIKDANALTAQHITIEGITPEALKKVKIKDIEIRPIRYFHTKLSSYYLLGNNFRIVVRGVSRSEADIQNRISKVVEELEALGGAPNFFGHQRFGTKRPITHLVGKALIKGNFRKAAMLFLAKPSPNEHPESRKAREELWQTQDFKKALKEFPKNLHYERLMLRHLAKKPDDFVGAFRRLPTKLRILFPQAYQAYLFNRILSRRIAQGLQLNRAELGDYVVGVEPSGLPNTTQYKVANQETISEINKALKLGKMFLALPLAGFRQKLSEGVQGEIEKFVLEEEGVFLENFKIKGMPELSLKGGLRTALAPLKGFSLNKISKDEANPHKKKVAMSFMLYRGSYATVLLREIMKPRNLLKAGF